MVACLRGCTMSRLFALGVQVLPFSVQHAYEGSFNEASPELTTCNPGSMKFVTNKETKQEVAEGKEVIFTYDVLFLVGVLSAHRGPMPQPRSTAVAGVRPVSPCAWLSAPTVGWEDSQHAGWGQGCVDGRDQVASRGRCCVLTPACRSAPTPCTLRCSRARSGGPAAGTRT
jgi:hypothetical protein